MIDNRDMDKQKDNCETYQILMMGYIDGELDPDQERRFKEHAYQCPKCAEELVSLPMFPELSREQIEKVARNIIHFQGS